MNRSDPFRTCYGTKISLVVLVHQEMVRGSPPLLILFDILVAFNTITHGIFLNSFSGLRLGETILHCFSEKLVSTDGAWRSH